MRREYHTWPTMAAALAFLNGVDPGVGNPTVRTYLDPSDLRTVVVEDLSADGPDTHTDWRAFAADLERRLCRRRRRRRPLARH